MGGKRGKKGRKEDVIHSHSASGRNNPFQGAESYGQINISCGGWPRLGGKFALSRHLWRVSTPALRRRGLNPDLGQGTASMFTPSPWNFC
jgi:hypothetical protein